MKQILFQPRHVVIMIFCLALAGCLGGPSAPTNFYMLTPLTQTQAGTSSTTTEGRIRIGLVTVVTPEYLNRNEIVVNLDNTVYQLAEFNQWALLGAEEEDLILMQRSKYQEPVADNTYKGLYLRGSGHGN